MSTAQTRRSDRLVVLPQPDRPSPEPEFVEFFRTGATARGWFSCAECEWLVRSVRQLPDCPSCGGRLWEAANTPIFDLDDWEEEVQDVARFHRGLGVALVLAPLAWLVTAALAVALVLVARG
jgi:hypothetical protein